MSTLIFQIHIKQWQKNQRSSEDVAARAALPDRFSINAEPGFFVLNRPCVIDQYTDGKAVATDTGRSLKTAMMKDGAIMLERFRLSQKEDQLILAYDADETASIEMGCLNNGWIQAHYNWRYAVEQDGQMYWLYEEVTLNAACVQTYDSDYFLSHEPTLMYSGD